MLKEFGQLLGGVKTIGELQDWAAKIAHLAEKGAEDRTPDDTPAAQTGQRVIPMPPAWPEDKRLVWRTGPGGVLLMPEECDG
jgi:hypothetical protein